jgi:NAD+ diphosphatase
MQDQKTGKWIPVMRRDDNYYSNPSVDRSARIRGNADWVASLRDDPASRYVAVWKGKSLIAGDPEAPAAAMLDGAAAAALLGLRDETAYFAIDLPPDQEPAAALLADGREFVDLRQVGALLDDEEAALLAYARGLAYWHQRHLFCGRCGGPMAPADGGHARRCRECQATDFPRTDPAVIMLITDGDRALMGASPRYPQGLYSTLAGFVEVGESLEGAVRREVAEEAGIRVGAVRYHSSQAWPFPRSLMVGYYGEAETTEIDFDPQELVDCRWFTRDELADQERRRLELMPRSESISRRLIYDWLNEG